MGVSTIPFRPAAEKDALARLFGVRKKLRLGFRPDPHKTAQTVPLLRGKRKEKKKKKGKKETRK